MTCMFACKYFHCQIYLHYTIYGTVVSLDNPYTICGYVRVPLISFKRVDVREDKCDSMILKWQRVITCSVVVL